MLSKEKPRKVANTIVESGNEIGPFRAIEESTLAQLTPAANRSDIYAWYSLIGTAGTACGMVVSGWTLHYLMETLMWDEIRAYRAVFIAYAIFGLIKLCLALSLSKTVEAEKKGKPTQDLETTPLLGEVTEGQESKHNKNWLLSKLPGISPDSRTIVFNLCLLFALDAFASGLAPL